MGGGLQPGDLVGDSYRLGHLLGEGGMGWVWQATNLATDQAVALKILKGGKEEDRRRFLREVRAAAAIRHPHVIAVHDFLELPDGTLVIVMDLLEGETLGAVLRRDARISLGDLAAIALPVLGALEAAHALGIVHRDLKPDNIFLCRAGAEVDVKVLDFGVAKLTAEDGLAARTQALTGTGSMVGTPYYMSPEQVFADKDLDARADVWSLGVVMYECLAGLRPTEADTVGRVLKKIMEAGFPPLTAHGTELPDDVVALVGSMLALDRNKRPGLAAIREVLAPHARATNRAVSVMSPRRQRTRTDVLAYGAVGVLALLGGSVALRGRESTDRKPFSVVASVASGVPVAASDAPLGLNEPAPRPNTTASPPARGSTEPAQESPPTAASVVTARPTLPALRQRPPPVTSAGAAALSRPACEPGDVSSEGHCCPKGHQWRAGRCERPLATSF
jgi:serine/threonine-protein kinase